MGMRIGSEAHWPKRLQGLWLDAGNTQCPSRGPFGLAIPKGLNSL